jgi:thiol peroxidase
MATITLKGNEIHTIGSLPSVGDSAKDFQLTGVDLSTKTLTDFTGHNLILNIFPSIDTGTCAMSVRNFNKEAANLKNTKVLCISRDLPFAQNRFCGAEGIETDGPLAGLNSRSIVIVNPEGEVTYTEQVTETVDEPNYEAALASL